MISIKVDLKQFERGLDDVARRQIPFAASKALNDVALAVQAAEQSRLGEVFTLRRKAWAEKSVKITHFAKKQAGELFATIAISPPGAPERADILAKFEDQTAKRSVKPSGHVAIPVSAKIKRGNAGVIASRDRPGAYNFKRVGKAIVGDRGTFIVPSKTKPGAMVILQRTGFKGARLKKGQQGPQAPAGKANVYALYLLVPRVKITPDLHFVDTAVKLIPSVWERAMATRLTEALRSTR